ncbi:cysteine protease ATG4C [Phyllobates terribilis]|uniref:cysteine protease ATG4C n=1 Tax=Phyllobates terribilis TaxID=111132 RepID=UPI003CCB3094
MEASGSDERVKSMILSAWHNVKYSWVLRTRTYFRRNSPVFLLGKCYHFKFEESESSPDCSDSGSVTNEDVFGTAEDFRKDFISRIWLTYREEFPQLEGSTWSTDCGWGCTLRTGQMLLAQGLLVHFIGRDWLWPKALDLYRPEAEFWLQNSARKLAPIEASYNAPTYNTAPSRPGASTENEDENQSAFYHRKIVSWFSDHPGADFGIHQLIRIGRKSGKMAGDWYGPAIVSHLLRKAKKESADPELQNFSIYVAQDCTIYLDDVYDLQDKSDSDQSVLILVPVRLGGERTNTEYFEFVKGILSLEYCVGIIGGRPKQSYYFVGFQDDSLIYMDPHYCQSFVDVSTKDFPLESFHCPSPKKMPFKKMDPSCALGFYCRNSRDFEKVVEELTKVLKSSSRQNYPLFTFVDGHAQDFDFVCAPVYEQNDLFTEEEKNKLKSFNTEEFVLL